MRSTGEVMGISDKFSLAFAKSQIAAGVTLPTEGKVFVSFSCPAQRLGRGSGQRPPRTRLRDLGHQRNRGSAGIGRHRSLIRVKKLSEGKPNLIDYLKNEDVALDLEHAQRKRGSDG